MQVIEDANGQKTLEGSLTEIETLKEAVKTKIGKEPTMKDMVEHVELGESMQINS